METEKFEESIREAFDDAEVSPSGSVWTNIELDIEKSTGGKMKRRLLFFQLLAAASMVFAMGIGSVYFLSTSVVGTQPITDGNTKTKDVLPDKTIAKGKSDNNAKSSTPKKVIPNDLKDANKKNITITNHIALNSQRVEIIDAESSNRQEVKNSQYKERFLPNLVEVKEPKLKILNPEVDAGMLLLAKLKDEEKKYQKDKHDLKEKVWAAVGMGAGTFNPNTTSSSANPNGFGSPASSSSNPSSGTSYSVGVSIGGKISKRLVLQGGISYLNQNAAFTSSAASGAKASMNEFTATRADQIVATSPYRVNSNLQYMSVPIQAGYIIIDRTFAVQLNGGISTDLFFQSTITPESGALDKVTQSAGADSPYRTVNFSGLVGTELSYRVGSHYRIAVNPGMRYSLNSIYKSEVATQISPVTVDVSLRFRYIF